MIQIQAKDAVLDFSVYPRKEVDSATVRAMLEAYMAGAQFPPVLLEAGTRRVVDGFHRITVYMQVPEGKAIPAIEKKYANDSELLAHAIRLNACHGKPLTAGDREMCVAKGRQLGLSVAEVASALQMTVEKAGELGIAKVHSRPPVSEKQRRVQRSRRPQDHEAEPSAIEPRRISASYNAARAEQVMRDITGSLQAAEADIERVAMLIDEARAGEYYRAHRLSEVDFILLLAAFCGRIRAHFDGWTSGKSKGEAA